MPRVVFGKRLVLLTLFATSLFGAALSPTVGKAGFFEELFGVEPSAPQLYPPPARLHSRRAARVRSRIAFAPAFRHESVRKSQIAYIPHETRSREDVGDTAAGSRPVKPAFCTRRPDALNNASRFRQLLNDKTLRAGDIVVTDAGIRVFEGQEACPHTSKDFVALGAAELSRSKKGVLAQLELSMRFAARQNSRR